MAILDIRLGEHSQDGIELARELQSQQPPVRALIYSNYGMDAYARKCREIGIPGYVLKEEPPEVFIWAIYAVAQGDVYYSREVASRLAGVSKTGLERTGISRRPWVTAREGEVLQLIAEGYSNASICRVLSLAKGGVSTHISHLFAKFEAENRVDLVVRAARLGLICIDY